MKRLEFTDKQKALIYERDKWLCAFSWKILWVLHYGSSTLWDIDWVDHILPAAKWWDNSIDNWICASSFYNSKKKDNSYDNKYLFLKWLPTEHYFTSNWYFSDELLNYIVQYKNLHYSDWFLNRALFNLMLAVENLYNPYNTNWTKSIRDYKVYSERTFKRIQNWKKEVKSSWISNYLERLWIDINKLWNDQKLMLDIFDSNSTDEIIIIAKKLLPYYKNSSKYFLELLDINNIEYLQKLKTNVSNEKIISLRDKDIILKSIEELYWRL